MQLLGVSSCLRPPPLSLHWMTHLVGLPGFSLQDGAGSEAGAPVGTLPPSGACARSWAREGQADGVSCLEGSQTPCRELPVPSGLLTCVWAWVPGTFAEPWLLCPWPQGSGLGIMPAASASPFGCVWVQFQQQNQAWAAVAGRAAVC